MEKFFGVKWTDYKKVPKELRKIIDDILYIDPSEPIKNLPYIPHHESKVISIIYSLTVERLVEEEKFNKLKKQKYNYYTFKINEKLTATQIKVAVDGDKDIIESSTRISLIKAQEQYFLNVLKQFKEYKEMVKSFMYWENYISGNK